MFSIWFSTIVNFSVIALYGISFGIRGSTVLEFSCLVWFLIVLLMSSVILSRLFDLVLFFVKWERITVYIFSGGWERMRFRLSS